MIHEWSCFMFFRHGAKVQSSRFKQQRAFLLCVQGLQDEAAAAEAWTQLLVHYLQRASSRRDICPYALLPSNSSFNWPQSRRMNPTYELEQKESYLWKSTIGWLESILLGITIWTFDLFFIWYRISIWEIGECDNVDIEHPFNWKLKYNKHNNY